MRPSAAQQAPGLGAQVLPLGQRGLQVPGQLLAREPPLRRHRPEQPAVPAGQRDGPLRVLHQPHPLLRWHHTACGTMQGTSMGTASC